MFTRKFQPYASIGDSISCELGGLRYVAWIAPDETASIEELQQGDEAVAAWYRGEWEVVGVVVSVECNGITLERYAASMWGVDCNHPFGDGNTHLTAIANDLLPDAQEVAETLLRGIDAIRP